DILSDLGAGLVGGLGLVPGANYGDGVAVFEAVHGSAPDIAGKGLANPIAIILSAANMMHYLGEPEMALRIEKAVRTILRDRKRLTRDLGGEADTDEFTKALIEIISLRQIT
ncbi:MAG: isocitrate/isopropylmalate family dehydrogenase, partial [Methanomassiliicoccales archaeon]|nr:isocitrate/isopropylmalate family dehydrogenase [Methanomassiliicoccales archaeon]